MFGAHFFGFLLLQQKLINLPTVKKKHVFFIYTTVLTQALMHKPVLKEKFAGLFIIDIFSFTLASPLVS